MEERIFTEADLEQLKEDLSRIAAQQGDENLSVNWTQLQAKALSFINNYEALLHFYNLKRVQEVKTLISNPLTASKKMDDMHKDNTIFHQSSYLLAFDFDNSLTSYLGEVPKKALFVYQGGGKKTSQTVKTYEMSLIDLVQFINSEGRFSQNSKQLNAEANKDNFKIVDAEKTFHVLHSQAAYLGVYNRLERFYEIRNKSGTTKMPQKQSGMLMWKIHGEWKLGYVLNYGDAKEAYAASLMIKHQSNLDKLCNYGLGKSPYYDHELIGEFFNTYIYAVTNRPAIVEEDIIGEESQWAVKSLKAATPSLDQYLTTAREIISRNNPIDAKKLKQWIYENFDKNVHRNHLMDINDKYVNEIYSEMIKDIQKKS